MKAYIPIAALALMALGAGTAQASPELAKAKNCTACHAVSTKLVGPAFKDIAAKYAGNKEAEAMLAQKIRKGSTGVWGAIPMPANPQVNEAEATTLAQWVLSQK
ncbi:c-type cytochrome [Duganella callida]|uniref:C-type cytochrome n=1 Tax=Duganella callida TaxID=2561932 RepID=A0A4Y9SAQ8_9BURK|nr:c-type cytochrome [Duganella callida]TFW17249.1 c-type cytochrome [Duganella callida]